MRTKTKFLASVLVHWSTGPVACCDKHARALVGLGNMLGTHVAVTQLVNKAECVNCKNENEAEDKK